MNRRLCVASVCLAFLLPAVSHAQGNAVPELPGVSPAAHQGGRRNQRGEDSRHVRFLSDDLLEGRGPGKRGAEIAAQYIATQYMLAGLKPAGENGTYFQKVPLLAVHTIEDQTSFSLEPNYGAAIPSQYGVDYVTKDETGAASAEIDAPIVFVGYGIEAPEYSNWNDYKGRGRKGQGAAGDCE